MITEMTNKLVRRQALTGEETAQVMYEMMAGNTSAVQTAGFLTALQAKGATVTEITACARVMREHAVPVAAPAGLLEIVGTGGDHSGSFNISTTAALVCAAAGCRVAKHGNRSATSSCGAADVLEALGADLYLSPAQSMAVLEETGFCFFFAQQYHQAMKYVGPVRRELGIPTVFNILGPLTNPAHAELQVLGVYDEALVEPLAQVLHALGVVRGMVVHGTDGLDEISPSAPTKICEFVGSQFHTYTLRPEEVHVPCGKKEELKGGAPEKNAAMLRAVLAGEPGTCRTAVLLNAGAALYVAQKAPTIEAGVRLAARLIDEGKALQTLQRVIQTGRDLREATR